MKKFLIFLCLIPTFIYSADNQSLSQFMLRNYDWKNDGSHIVHVGTRCATVMDAAVWRYSADNRAEVQKMADSFKQLGDMYLFSTAALAEKKVNFTSEGYTKLYKSWMETYKEMAEENAIKYNDFYHGMLGEDYVTCTEKSNIEFYKSLLEAMANQ